MFARLTKMRLLVLALLSGCTQHPSAHAAAWTTISRGGEISVAVEHALYERPESPHFFVHVRITNAGAGAIDADLRHYFEAFYPNQWGASRLDHRETIDERRRVLAAFAPAADHAGFTRIAPGTFDYYSEFNASSRAEVERAPAAPWLIVSMDGQLNLGDRRLEPSEPHEVPIRTPVAWKPIPAGAKILAD